MTKQQTPGIWDEIPKGAVVTATWNDQRIKGTLKEVYRSGADAHKCMILEAPPLGSVTLDARDHWDVTYESLTLADELILARIGDLFSNRDGSHEIIKLSENHVSSRVLSGGYWEAPELRLILDYEHVPQGVYELRPRP